MKSFVRDLYQDEIRDGFLVTSQRKKLWNVQIRLILEVDRICKKHGLTWFADGGTMLGAARHGGFIPWDDDVDIAMLRPDYDQFMKIAPTELDSNYFLDDWRNYRLEEETSPAEYKKYPLVSKRSAKVIRENDWYWPIQAGYSKLRDSSTTMIQWRGRKNINQGIWIDIFPFDAMPPYDDEQDTINFESAKELMLVTFNRPKVEKMIEAGEKFVTPLERLKELIKLPFRDRAIAYEEQIAKNFPRAKYVCWLKSYLNRNERHMEKAAPFDKTVLMPFETIEIPLIVGYDELLTYYFGDWHKQVFEHGHVSTYSADISYKDYFKLVDKR